jgi:hypothetical protein
MTTANPKAITRALCPPSSSPIMSSKPLSSPRKKPVFTVFPSYRSTPLIPSVSQLLRGKSVDETGQKCSPPMQLRDVDVFM